MNSLDECARGDSRQEYLSSDITVAEMVLLIGWTHEEFVEACIDYIGEETYDWQKVLTSLWESTCNRIHSNLDVIHKFRYYNDWKYAVDYALTLKKSRMADPQLCDFITLEDLEIYLKNKDHKNKPILPTETYEKKIFWAIIQIILHLYHFTQKHPQCSYNQIINIRESVEFIQQELEDRRTARRNKKWNKKINKKNSRK